MSDVSYSAVPAAIGSQPTGAMGMSAAVGRGRASQTDEALLTAAAAGDEVAWAELVARLQPTVWAATGVLGVPKSAAVSMCELVWLRLTQLLDEPPHEVRPWLVAAVEAEAARWHSSPRTS